MADLLLFDVSKWQSGAYAGGGGFAGGIAKLTEGVGYKDDAADRHMAAILAQPIVPGGYHFNREDLNPGTAGAYAEADWFWRVATSYGGAIGMLLANDAENGAGSRQWNEDFAGRLAWRLGGYNALFYSYWAWMQSRSIVGSDLLSRDPLWFAWPDANGSFPGGLAVSMQQYGLASVPGISGGCDANRFFGDAGQLAALTVGGGLDMASSDEILRVANATYWMAATGYDSDPSGAPPPQHYGVFKDVPASVAGANAKLDVLLAAQGVEQAAIDAIAAKGAAATSVAVLAAKLDAVLAGLPPAQSDSIKAELVTLGKHLGVDVTQPS